MGDNVDQISEWILEEIYLHEKTDGAVNGRGLVEAVAAKWFPKGVSEAWMSRWGSVATSFGRLYFDPEFAPFIKMMDEAKYLQAVCNHERAAGREPSEELREAIQEVGARLRAYGEELLREGTLIREWGEYERRK
jgi:hypothetical protein